MDKIKSINETNNFLNYYDYFKLYQTLDDEEKKSIIRSYRDLITQVYQSHSSGYFSLDIFRFWKDFFYLFYLALNIIKEYKSNSIIISLGESPAKLVFVQSLFCNDDDINNKLKIKNYPTDLNFKYLPLSKLSKLLLTYPNGDELKPFINKLYVYHRNFLKDVKYNYAKTIELMNSNYNKTIECNFKNYIINANLDIRNIIASDKNIIFVDRAERLNTAAALFFLYTKLNTWVTLLPEEKNIFISKFSFFGFDIASDDEKEDRIDRINNFKSFIKNLLDINDTILEKIIKIKIVYYSNSQRKEIISDMENKDKTIFKKSSYILKPLLPFNTIAIVINFISMPELSDLGGRCIKSYDLKNDLPDDLLINFKQTNEESVNCNFFNFIIFLIFMKLKKTNKFDKLIDNIDNININLFYKDKETDIPLDDFIKNLPIKQNFVDFFLNNPQIISKTIFNDEITFSYNEVINKDAVSFKNKYLKYKNKYLKYKNKYLEYKTKLDL
jgi:hypothetical protein